MFIGKLKFIVDKLSKYANKMLNKIILSFKHINTTFVNKFKKCFDKIYKTIYKHLVFIKNDKSAKINLITNYIAPVITIVALIVTCVNISNKQFGLTVKYDGQTVATIQNESVIDKAQEIFNYNCAIPVEDATTPITYEITEIKNEEELEISSYSIFKKIVSLNTSITKDVTGIYIDGKFIGATYDVDELKSAISDIFEEYKNSQSDIKNIECSNEIKYASGIYPTDSLCECEELVEKVSKLLNVTIIKDIYTTTDIPYKIEYRVDYDKYIGSTSVDVYGENGTQISTTRNKYFNDELVSSQDMGVEVIEEPINQIISVGAKEIPLQAGDVVLTWPAPTIEGYESDFGYRWGRMHSGVDMAGVDCYGDGIVAADDGVVTFAGYDYGGYGYYIIIDHLNGMKTLYAHCSDIYVSVDDTVSAGECIAAIGSSGRSTGAHLHFEVHINDVAVNPKLFL